MSFTETGKFKQGLVVGEDELSFEHNEFEASFGMPLWGFARDGNLERRLQIELNSREIKECGREGLLMHGLPPQRISQASWEPSAEQYHNQPSASDHATGLSVYIS